MAKFEQSVGFDEFMDSLSKLDFEYFARGALRHAAPIVGDKLISLSEKHCRTGAMMELIEEKNPKKAKNGEWHVFIGPSGKDENGVWNIEKWHILSMVCVPTINQLRQ